MREALCIAPSRSGKEIRLTPTIWLKVERGHPEFSRGTAYLEEIKRAVEDPDYIVRGWAGELLALRWCEAAPSQPKYLCTVYRELNDDGFIITAFFVSRYEGLLKRGILWQRN